MPLAGGHTALLLKFFSDFVALNPKDISTPSVLSLVLLQ